MVLVKGIQKDSNASDFFSLLPALYNFFSESAKRHEKFIYFQQFGNEMDRVILLKNLSKTRWYCQIDAIRAVRKANKPLVQTLQNMHLATTLISVVELVVRKCIYIIN